MSSGANVSSGLRAPPKTLQEAKANIDMAQQETNRTKSYAQKLNQDMANRMRMINEEVHATMRKEDENFKQKMSPTAGEGDIRAAERTLQAGMDAAIEKLRKDNQVELQKLRADATKKIMDKQKEVSESRDKAVKAAQDKAKADSEKVQKEMRDADEAAQKAFMAFQDAMNIYNTMLRQQGAPKRGGGRTFRKRTRRHPKKHKRGASRR